MPHKSSEVSDMFDIEPRTLFVYESENLIAPERTPTQRRRYSRRDIERIRLIRELTTAHGINLAGVKVIFSLTPSSPSWQPPDTFGVRSALTPGFRASTRRARCWRLTSMAPSPRLCLSLTSRPPTHACSSCWEGWRSGWWRWP